jgi:hypothetical protein
MTTPLLLAERVTALEYAVFGEFPATMAAMSHGATHLYAETVANGEAIAGLHVDLAALQATLHGEVANLKAVIDLQGDRLRKELGVATAGFRADVTGLRETMSTRFQKVDGQFNAVHAEMNHRFEAVDQRFDAVDQRFDAVDERFEGLGTQLRDLRVGMDAKLDTILSELRKPAD